MKRFSKSAVLIMLDILAINLSYILAFLIRFEFKVDSDLFGGYFAAYTGSIFILTIIKIVSNVVCSSYRSFRVISDFPDLQGLLSIFFSALLGLTATAFFFRFTNQVLPLNIYLITLLLDILFYIMIRLIMQFFKDFDVHWMKSILDKGLSEERVQNHAGDGISRVLLIGLGNTGAALIKELNQHPALGKKVLAAIDDDSKKRNKRIAGVKVVGNRNDIRRAVRRYGIDEVIISIPSSNKKALQEIVAECNKTKCTVRIIPSILDLINDNFNVSELYHLGLNSFMDHENISVDHREIEQYISGKIILVTGAGGDVGAELCRQILRYQPRKIVALDVNENSAFHLINEVKINYPDMEVTAEIGSIQDEYFLRDVFYNHKPHIVFHCASYKNIELMEQDPKEAIMNNIAGTGYLADISNEFLVEKLLFISTDKSIKPKSVVGATKRIGELILQEKSKTSRTEYLTVRFGNTLESSAMILPSLKRQITIGGPVTVSNIDDIIYFRSLSDTVKLVLQAGAIGSGGQVFDIDMGKPTRVLDLAEKMVRLSGYIPGEDIEIKIIGTKVIANKYNDSIIDYSKLEPTSNKSIYVGVPAEPSERITALLQADSRTMVQILLKIVRPLSVRDTKQWLHEMVPEYRRTL